MPCKSALLHRLVTGDGKYRSSAYLRWSRTVAYALIATSGALLLASPIFVPAFGPAAPVMSWFLVVGGVSSMVGAATRHWVGEFAGLPLLMTAFVSFGLLSLRASFQETPYIAAANMALLLGFAIAMSSRWRVVYAVFRLADRFSGAVGDHE